MIEVTYLDSDFDALYQRFDPLAVAAAEQQAMNDAVEYAYNALYRNWPVGVSEQHTRDRFEKSVEQEAGTGYLTGYITSSDIQALVLEEGRAPGAKPPPSSAIADWVGDKVGDAALAYVVARAIGQQGIAAHHIFQAVAERTQDRLGQLFEPALSRLFR